MTRSWRQFLPEVRLVVSAVIMKAQNRHTDCWNQADLFSTTGAMLGGTVMKHCVLADTYCSLSAVITQTEVEKFSTKTVCRIDVFSACSNCGSGECTAGTSTWDQMARKRLSGISR